MCDICHRFVPGEMSLHYVLVRSEDGGPGFYTGFILIREAEVCRVTASVCVRCFREKVGLGGDAEKQQGFWTKLQRRWREAVHRSPFEVLEEIAKAKLGEQYPLEVAKIGRTFHGMGEAYSIKLAQDWDEQVRKVRAGLAR